MYYIFSLVSLLGAFLLFQIQPVISKFILPWFGGSPGVWTTCMLFFQAVLFAGYGYAHLLARMRPRTQAWVHGSALLLAMIFLPISPDAFWKPVGNEEPVGRILLLLLYTVGMPYLVLSATSPLVQVWFSRCYPKRSPWRLYSLSNIGSLTALLSYPVLIETRWDVVTQTYVWSGAFVIFAILMGTCLFASRARGDEVTPEGDLHPQVVVHDGKPAWARRLLWLLLPGLASMTLLATTNHVCQDVAVIPFLWVAPLSLYLISFIICFDHPRWYRRAIWALPAMILIFLASGLHELPWPNDWSPGFVVELVLLLGAMFLVCMVCHGELAELKPGTKYLTEYYLLMSAGGALGGLIVSVVAPMLFKVFLEWSLALLIGFALVSWIAYRGLFKNWRGIKAWCAGICWLVIAAAGLWWMQGWEFNLGDRLERRRDFYGMLSVSEYAHEVTKEPYRTFISGGTTHGRQSLLPSRRREPLTYYGADTGAGLALSHIRVKLGARVGVIGMGAGTVACYAEPGQTYRFYELNPGAVDLALRWFTFIPDMEARGAKYELAPGDARLSLEHEPAQKFDMLLLDAFSGDSVPVHLLTWEAFALYNRHLNPEGIIAVHITNHYLNLAPVVERAAKEFGFSTVRIATDGRARIGTYDTDYVLLTRDQKFIRSHPPAPPSFARDVPVPLWTDHRHNLFQILLKR